MTVGLPPTERARHELIDALRGIALFGILAVNIQGFAWFGGGGPALGVIWEDAPFADTLVVFLTALLLEMKFYPIFCFCFGYGFAVMGRRWRQQGADVRARFTRRIHFLLGLGIFHGAFIWFGDILSRYAITAYVLRRHIGKGPKALLKPLKFWLAFALLFAIASCVAAYFTPPPLVDEITEPMMEKFKTFTYGSYLEQTPERLKVYALITGTWLFLIPQAMALFLCGAIVAQLGWLRHPARHAAVWRRILWVSLALGVLPSIAQAFAAVALGVEPAKPISTLEMFGYSFSVFLAPAYIAALALTCHTPIVQRLIRLVTPAGRMALTVYLAQSIIVGFLLLGYGAKLAGSGQAMIFLIAVGVYAFLLAASHWTLARYAQGPVETLWRRYTYASAETPQYVASSHR